MSASLVDIDPSNPLRFRFEVNSQRVVVAITEEGFDDYYSLSNSEQQASKLNEVRENLTAEIMVWLLKLEAHGELEAAYILGLDSLNILLGVK